MKLVVDQLPKNPEDCIFSQLICKDVVNCKIGYQPICKDTTKCPFLMSLTVKSESKRYTIEEMTL